MEPIQRSPREGRTGPEKEIAVSTVDKPVVLTNAPDNFTAGKLSLYHENWTKLTTDKYILDIIANGYQIEFSSHPCASCDKKEIQFSVTETIAIESLLQKLLFNKVIEKAQYVEGQVISNIFVVPKQDGTFRLILNLKNLNEHVEKKHFKMETLKTALQLVKKNCFFAKLDFKDAYYSVPIHKDFRKYIRFTWRGQLFQFTCLPNGLSSAPRIFTKILKPVLSSLREKGQTNCAYIGDVLLQADSYGECESAVSNTVSLVDSIGLTTHPSKSIFIPTQEIEFVGFLINSMDMTVRLSSVKMQSITDLCKLLLRKRRITIRELAQIVGKMVACEPGVPLAPLYYKPLEIQKDSELKTHCGQFDRFIILAEECRECLRWWIANLHGQFRSITFSEPDRVIESDSSLSGFGAHDVTSGGDFSGVWHNQDTIHHINYLELKAAFLALKHFCSSKSNEHVRLLLDNTTAIKYLNKMGGRKPLFNNLTKEIWEWCVIRNIWLSVYHIPGKDNQRADALSRQKLSVDMEWEMHPDVFEQIMNRYGRCEVDLFASCQNFKLPKYVSFGPDRNAWKNDAFSLSWSDVFVYIFPPFSVLGKVLQKLDVDQGEAVLVAPVFTTQPWFPKLLHMIAGPAHILPDVSKVLLHQKKDCQHRLTKMVLGVFRLSGKPSAVRDYQMTLPKSSSRHGVQELKNSMPHIYRNGLDFVVKGKLIHLSPL